LALPGQPVLLDLLDLLGHLGPKDPKDPPDQEDPMARLEKMDYQDHLDHPASQGIPPKTERPFEDPQAHQENQALPAFQVILANLDLLAMTESPAAPACQAVLDTPATLVLQPFNILLFKFQFLHLLLVILRQRCLRPAPLLRQHLKSL